MLNHPQVISNVPPQLAAQWFPANQRATATAVAWSAQSIGVALGYLLAPTLAKTTEDIPTMMKYSSYRTRHAVALLCDAGPATPVSRCVVCVACGIDLTTQTANRTSCVNEGRYLAYTGIGVFLLVLAFPSPPPFHPHGRQLCARTGSWQVQASSSETQGGCSMTF